MKILTDCQAEGIVGGGSLITISPRITTNVSPRITTNASPRIATNVSAGVDLESAFALNNQGNFSSSVAIAVLGSSASSFNGIMRNRASIGIFS